MKQFALIAALLLFGAPRYISAQVIYQHDICPDWTFTDIQGNEHNLYSYLDAGYTVFFAVSSTWCPPCWDHHLSRSLDSLYLSNGPGTAASNVMAFLIEADDSTGSDELHGISGNTLGDWVTGTAYPIIDNAQAIMPLLNTNWYGFVWGVCPSRVIEPPGGPFNVDELNRVLNYCGDYHLANSPNDAALQFVPRYDVCEGASPPLVARLQNIGTSPLTSATIQSTIYVDQDQLTPVDAGLYQWTGNLGTYDFVELALAQTPLPTGSHTNRMRLIGPDDNPLNDELGGGLQSSTIAPGTTMAIEVLTDANGDQLSWLLYREGTNIPIAGQGYGTLAANSFYSYPQTLIDGACYSFIISTMTQTGLNAPGYFDIKVNNASITGGATLRFQSQVIQFRADYEAGIGDDPMPSRLSLQPNPMNASSQLNLHGVRMPAELHVRDASGRAVHTETLRNTESITLRRGQMAPGLYLVSVRDAVGAMHTVRLAVE